MTSNPSSVSCAIASPSKAACAGSAIAAPVSEDRCEQKPFRRFRGPATGGMVTPADEGPPQRTKRRTGAHLQKKETYTGKSGPKKKRPRQRRGRFPSSLYSEYQSRLPK